MKKILKMIRNFILGILLFTYLSFTIVISTLLLNRNDYGTTQFKDKALILITKEVANKKYNEGNLVIVEKVNVEDLNIGDEVFIYKTNKKTKTVTVVISEVGKINLEATSPYIVLANDGTAWGEDFIAGKAINSYEKIGTLLSFIESKWVFFCLLIVPCFFILLYEIHLVIVTIRFGDDEDEEMEEENYKSEIESKNEEIEELMKQIKELKKETKTKDKSEENKETKKTKTTKNEEKDK